MKVFSLQGGCLKRTKLVQNITRQREVSIDRSCPIELPAWRGGPSGTAKLSQRKSVFSHRAARVCAEKDSPTFVEAEVLDDYEAAEIRLQKLLNTEE